MPGTITPEQEPFEQVTETHAPASSSTARCVVEPSREPMPDAAVSIASLCRKRSR